MSSIRVERTRATVTVLPDQLGTYTGWTVKELRDAVLAICRAIDNDEAHTLAACLDDVEL